MSISGALLSGVLAQQVAIREGLPDANKFLLLGWALGSSPIGLGVTLVLANREAEQLPPPVPQASPLSITTTSLPNAESGVAYQATLAAKGGVKPFAWSLSAGKLPGLNLDPQAGTISGTTTGSGSFKVTIQVVDANGAKASQPFTITVNPAVSITTTTLPGGSNGVAYNTTLAATGGTQPFSWSVTTGSLPAGLTLDPNAGTISGTPTIAAPSNFTVQVTDAVGGTASQALTLTVA